MATVGLAAVASAASELVQIMRQNMTAFSLAILNGSQHTGSMNDTDTIAMNESRALVVYSTEFTVFLSVVCIALSLGTIAGNLLVLVSFYIERSIRTPGNYFIASLAISDLVIGIEGFPTLTLYVLFGNRWVFHKLLCEIWLWVDYTICLVSILTVLLITVDRYYSVVFATRYRRVQSHRRVQRQIIASWAVPALLFGVTIFGWERMGHGTSLDPKDLSCQVPFLKQPFVNMMLYLIYYWTVLIAMIILYHGIHKVAKRLERRNAAKDKQNVAIMATQLRLAQVGFGMVTTRSRESERSPSTNTEVTALVHNPSLLSTNSYGSVQTVSLSRSSDHLAAPTLSVPLGCRAVEGHVLRRTASTNEARRAKVNRGSIKSSKRPSKKAPSRKSTMSKLLSTDTPPEPIRKTRIGKSIDSYIDLDDDDQLLYLDENFGSDESVSSQPILDVLRNPGQLFHRRRQRTQAERRAHKAFRTITIIVGSFAVFWSPYYVVATVVGFCETCIPAPIFTISYYLCYVNSSLNPFCYAVANLHFRRVFGRMLHGDFRRR